MLAVPEIADVRAVIGLVHPEVDRHGKARGTAPLLRRPRSAGPFGGQPDAQLGAPGIDAHGIQLSCFVGRQCSGRDDGELHARLERAPGDRSRTGGLRCLAGQQSGGAEEEEMGCPSHGVKPIADRGCQRSPNPNLLPASAGEYCAREQQFATTPGNLRVIDAVNGREVPPGCSQFTRHERESGGHPSQDTYFSRT